MIKTKQDFIIPKGTELSPIGNKGYYLNLKDEKGRYVCQVVFSVSDINCEPEWFERDY